jgi:hypothetical protein
MGNGGVATAVLPATLAAKTSEATNPKEAKARRILALKRNPPGRTRVDLV